MRSRCSALPSGFGILFLSVAASFSPAAAQTPQATQDSISRHQVIDAQIALLRAQAEADTLAFDRLTADEFIVIQGSGELHTKAERLAEVRLRKAVPPPTGAELAEQAATWRLQVYGRTVLVTRKTTPTAFTPALWITTVWVLRDGRWQRAMNHETVAGRR